MLRGSVLRTAKIARRRQESMLVDLVEVSRPGKTGTIATNLSYTPDSEVVYKGPGHVKYIDIVDRSLERYDTSVTSVEYLLKVPIDAPEFKVGDTVRVLRTSDPNVPNNIPFRVANRMATPWPTIRRVIIEQVNDRGRP